MGSFSVNKSKKLAIIFAISAIAFVFMFDLFSQKRCANLNETQVREFLKSRIIDLGKSGDIDITNYKITSIKIPADPLKKSASISIKNSSIAYTLIIYDDCYSKWFFP